MIEKTESQTSLWHTSCRGSNSGPPAEESSALPTAPPCGHKVLYTSLWNTAAVHKFRTSCVSVQSPTHCTTSRTTLLLPVSPPPLLSIALFRPTKWKNGQQKQWIPGQTSSGEKRKKGNPEEEGGDSTLGLPGSRAQTWTEDAAKRRVEGIRGLRTWPLRCQASTQAWSPESPLGTRRSWQVTKPTANGADRL